MAGEYPHPQILFKVSSAPSTALGVRVDLQVKDMVSEWREGQKDWS